MSSEVKIKESLNLISIFRNSTNETEKSLSSFPKTATLRLFKAIYGRNSTKNKKNSRTKIPFIVRRIPR